MVGELGRGKESTVQCETYLGLKWEQEGESIVITQVGWGNNVFCSPEICF